MTKLDFTDKSPEFSSTAEQRIRANLVCELKRHLPNDRTLLYGKLAKDLTTDLVEAARRYDLDYYRKKMT